MMSDCTPIDDVHAFLSHQYGERVIAEMLVNEDRQLIPGRLYANLSTGTWTLVLVRGKCATRLSDGERFGKPKQEGNTL